MSQYSLIVPGLYCRGLDRRLCHNTKFCIVTVDWARWPRDRACWARRQALGARLGEQGSAGATSARARAGVRSCGHELALGARADA